MATQLGHGQIILADDTAEQLFWYLKFSGTRDV